MPTSQSRIPRMGCLRCCVGCTGSNAAPTKGFRALRAARP
jgi:hypothetical protein